MRGFRYSLRIALAAMTLCAVFLALVRIADAPSAAIFLFFVFWLLLPVIATFVSLYLDLQGLSLRKRRRDRAAARTRGGERQSNA